MILELFSPGSLAVQMPGSDKHEIIRGLVQLLDGCPDVVDLEAVLRAVMTREEMMTTAVGEGLAIPHAKTDGVVQTIAAFANTSEPIEFGALDNKPVRLVFLLVGPESDNSKHIRFLSRASLLFCDAKLRDALVRAQSSEELMMLIENAEAGLSAG